MSKSMENLAAAFAGESQANRKYTAFAKKADEQGHAQLAKLFRNGFAVPPAVVLTDAMREAAERRGHDTLRQELERIIPNLDLGRGAAVRSGSYSSAMAPLIGAGFFMCVHPPDESESGRQAPMARDRAVHEPARPESPAF